MLASAGQDGQVFIWSQESPNKPQWQRVALDSFGDVVWRVSWSLSGNILAVTSGDSRVTLWKETLDRRQWQQISQLDAS
jgi:protein transport protein SEC13